MVRVSSCGLEGYGFESHYLPFDIKYFSLVGENGIRDRLKICSFLKVLVQVQY